MTEVKQVYKCRVCGNIVEVLHSGAGELVCCNQPMNLMVENTVDASFEKHVPVVEKRDGEVYVKIGSALHPMEEKHHIEWIEVLAGNRVYRKFLKAGDKPEATFKICNELLKEDITVREYCNLHGLWKA